MEETLHQGVLPPAVVELVQAGMEVRAMQVQDSKAVLVMPAKVVMVYVL